MNYSVTINFFIIWIPTLVVSLLYIRSINEFIKLYRLNNPQGINSKNSNDSNLVFLLDVNNFFKIQKELFNKQKAGELENARKNSLKWLFLTISIFIITTISFNLR